MNEKDHFFQSLFKTAMHAMIVIDDHGTILKINKAGQVLFQYKERDLLGKNIKILMPHKIARKHDSYLANYIKTGVKNIIGEGREVTGIAKDGKPISLFLSVSEVKEKDRSSFIAICHDLTDQEASKHEMKQLYQFYEDLTNTISHIDDYGNLIKAILSTFIDNFNVKIAHYYQYNEEKNLLESSEVFSCKNKDFFKQFIDVTKKTTFYKGVGLPGSAWKEEKIVCYENVYTSSNFPRASISKDLKIKGGIAFPLTFRKKILGVIEVYSNQEFKLSDNELKMFEKIQNFVETYYAFYQENRNLKLIFNAAGEGIYGLDLNGNATFINPAACQILGYSEQELIGVNMHEKVHYKYPNGKFYKKEDCYMFSAFKEGKSYHITNEVLWRKDKTAVEVEYTSTPIYENKKIVGAVITFIDVSSEAKFRHNINEIANIQEQYIKNENKKSIFNRILAYLLRITESEYGFIGSVLSSDAGLPYLKTHAITNIAWNDEMKLLYEKNNSKGIEFHNLETLFGYTLKNGESVISNDPATDERSGGLPKGHPALTSYLGVPIFGASGLIAMFGLGNKLGGYSKAILNELVPMTNMLSSILDSMHHHDMISDMAKIDSLTGVYNRNFFEQKINATIVSHREKKTLFSLLMLDLNDFKKINDFHGHDTGDKFLYLFCQKMKLILKEADFFSRIGGDEFCVILEDIKESNNAEKVAKRILEACDKKYLIDDKQIFCKPSIGIVTYPIAGESREILMKHVDFALYEAKKKSSGYEVYSALLKEHYLKITKMEEDIREAFEKKEFYCVYQPQMNTLTNKIHGIEVLLRWKHLDKGELSPTLFIPIIEKMKLSKQLNVYVLETCLKEIKSLKPDSPIIISLNLSPSIEELPDHLIELLTIIKKEKLHPNISLEFELTESSFISNSDEFEEKLFFAMGELKKANIRFAIDDFGVEYSSINRLIEYDFDTIKIDMLFVHKLSGDTPSSASAIIKAILGLSRDLGFDVVAEGAEKKEQIHALNILGCHIIQGFHFFKPLSKDSITKLINSSDKK